MPHARDSSVQEIVMEEAPVVQETRTSEKAPITKNVFGLKKTSITNKPTVLRRSSRIVPHAASKITKSYAKETSDRAKPLDKAAQLKKILRSKTNESKIEKPGLTLEKIEEVMIAMGITTASSSKTQAHPLTNLKSFMQQSSSHITPVASTSRQKLPGTTNDEHQGKSLQPGKSSHCLTGCMEF
jgi:hypothetical protein